jgi:hypothetical protein
VAALPLISSTPGAAGPGPLPRRQAAAAERAGVDVTTLVVPGAAHRTVMNTLLVMNSVVSKNVAAFMADTLER